MGRRAAKGGGPPPPLRPTRARVIKEPEREERERESEREGEESERERKNKRERQQRRRQQRPFSGITRHDDDAHAGSPAPRAAPDARGVPARARERTHTIYTHARSQVERYRNGNRSLALDTHPKSGREEAFRENREHSGAPSASVYTHWK